MGKSDTLKELFDEKVLNGTVIKTDGNASYPSAIHNHGSVHMVINYSVGFVTVDGSHTNNIENLWSHLKTESRMRRGVMKVNPEDFNTEIS